jgi:hypothetical protein
MIDMIAGNDVSPARAGGEFMNLVCPPGVERHVSSSHRRVEEVTAGKMHIGDRAANEPVSQGRVRSQWRSEPRAIPLD